MPWLGAFAVVACVLGPLAWAVSRLKSPLDSALALDERGSLKDRVSSAWEFLHYEGELDEPRRLQVRDAIRHAESLSVPSLFRLRLTRTALALPVFAGLFAASFFVPARLNPKTAEASVDARKQLQLKELTDVQKDIEREVKENPELENVLRDLKTIETRFQQGEMSERDVMIELARLEESLRKQGMQPGIDALEGEAGQMAPNLMASELTRGAAMALQEKDFEKAADEIASLAEKMKNQELSQEERDKLAMALGVAASKLGGDKKSALSSDLEQASEGLKSNDSQKFGDACRSLSNKLSSLGKYNQMKKASKRLSMCKSSLGQCKACKECNGAGCDACNGKGREGGSKGEGQGQGNGHGENSDKSNSPSLNWGTGTANPIGDPNRLAESYRKMIQASAQSTGEGPVESEVESVEGQTSPSQLDAKDVYADYASVAEEAIEREEIPLSQRLHVKRYFQTIRPAD
ncbi:MAG: efflux RND transporter permease subunit [Candidatus Hydrogenedentes bacterium]|nr:efflux RND transporter permease subunit [Candidatus Hydrogenedentota bacterium]